MRTQYWINLPWRWTLPQLSPAHSAWLMAGIVAFSLLLVAQNVWHDETDGWIRIAGAAIAPLHLSSVGRSREEYVQCLPRTLAVATVAVALAISPFATDRWSFFLSLPLVCAAFFVLKAPPSRPSSH
jgi:hypothetical protein